MESKKRKTFSVGAAIEKRDKLEADTSTALQDRIHTITSNPFLAPIVNPTYTIQIFLMEARIKARQFIQSKGLPLNGNSSIVEVEARLGIIKAPFGTEDKRITSSGAKTMELQGRDVLVHAFLCSTDGFDASKLSSNTSSNIQNCNTTRPPFEGGITRAHFTKWTSMGLSEPSPISLAYGVKKTTTDEVAQIKKDLVEHETVETVYGGYSHNRRVCFPGEHPLAAGRGKMESKMKLQTMDVAIPSAHYDLRMTLSTEEKLDDNLAAPPPRYQSKRLKRRRSYNRRDKSFAWQLDVTEVTTSAAGTSSDEQDSTAPNPINSDVIGYEIEVELLEASTLKLINLDDTQAQQFSKQLAEQLWWMMRQINPLSDVLDVDSYLREHTQQDAVKLALAQCFSLKKFLQEGKKEWVPAISTSGSAPLVVAPKTMNFIGSMPVNFQRHNIEDIQRSENSYYLSEKTDGVRYLMIFTGSTVVLLDRSHKGAQPKPVDSGSADPMQAIAALVQPGTVLDGEVVMHRELRRPIFIVFDVLCCGTTPILHLPFEERLRYLNQGLFVITNNGGNNGKGFLYATSAAMLSDKCIALPLVKKNFVRRTELDELLSHVQEERGVRIYKNGECHNHSTDGIIFQPNRPYVISTDIHLLKWKYLDTVTIDVELLPQQQQRRYASNNDESSEDVLRVGVLGDDGTIVEMTRFVKLPRCERLRLEADRADSGANIAEVGFDPDTGDWFYQTMRPDKKTSNHISTVLGTLLELAESLGTNELRYRMSVKGGQRDTYRKDIRSMQKQLLDFQRKKNVG